MFNKKKKNKKKMIEKVVMGAVIGGAIGSVVGVSLKKKKKQNDINQLEGGDQLEPQKKKSLIIRLLKSLIPGGKKRKISQDEHREIPIEE